MKKLGVLILSLIIVVSFVSCSKDVFEEVTDNITETTLNYNSDKVHKNSSKILIAYFSRYGNTDFSDDVDATSSASIVIDNDNKYGTTEYLAHMIKQAVGGNVYLIETEEKYSADFDELRDKNHKEMAENYLPSLKKKTLDISEYDTIFIGYPVWATDVPQAVLSFLNEYDLSDKTVIPFCTHDGYGAGNSYQSIADASHSKNTLDGLAVESVDVLNAQDKVNSWLNSIGIMDDDNSETQIEIKIGNTVLTGILYDTPLADEIKENLPVTVNMSNYGSRELYGRIDFTPKNIANGQLNFENGDITYCSTNNTLAIFYSQSDNPNLTMEVVPIGKVTFDLSVFNSLNSSEEVTFSLAK